MREFLEEKARKAREKALADSIAKAKQDSIDKAIHLAKIENYRNTHNWGERKYWICNCRSICCKWCKYDLGVC